MPTLRPEARKFVWLMTAFAGLNAIGLLLQAPPVPSLRLLLVLGLASAFGSKTIHIGNKVLLCVSLPFVLLAMLTDGPGSAVIAAIVAVATITLKSKRPSSPYKTLFNFSSLVMSTAVAWRVIDCLHLPTNLEELDRSVPVVLAASIAFFLFNSWSVSMAISLDGGQGVFTTWRQNLFWATSTYAVCGAFALTMAVMQRRYGTGILLLLAPFAYFVFHSFQLFQERREAEQKRIEAMQRHNRELESRVRERTQKLAESNQKLEESNAKLAEASRMKSAFLANVGHELRTPLNSIIGFSRLLQSQSFGSLTSEQREFADDIHASGRNLLTLINDLLDLSKIEAGKMTLHREGIRLKSVTDAAVSTVKVLADAKQIRLNVDIDTDIEVFADEIKIQQVLWNLLSNAIKFTDDGGSIGVSLVTSADTISITVSDSGIGIPESEIGKIFDPFYQVDDTHSRRAGGTGLGLGLARKFVELHGGTLFATSTPGHGSCFTFTLPLAKAEAVAVETVATC